MVDSTNPVQVWQGPGQYAWDWQNLATTRHAQTRMKLQTGSKGISSADTLYELSAQAYDMLDGRPLPLDDIAIGVLGWMGVDGYLWRELPANSTYDVTAFVNRVDYYSFNVSEAAF
jgi:hypothetical protein